MNRFTGNHNKGRTLAWINLTIGATLCAHSRPITTPHSSSTSVCGCDAYIQRPCPATRSSRKTWPENLISTWVEKELVLSGTNVLPIIVNMHSYFVGVCHNIRVMFADVSCETLGHGRRVEFLGDRVSCSLNSQRTWWPNVRVGLFNLSTDLYVKLHPVLLISCLFRVEILNASRGVDLLVVPKKDLCCASAPGTPAVRRPRSAKLCWTWVI